MQDGYTIGQVASRLGVPISTLRYYERAGLIQPSGRTEGNYRIYSGEALERVRFIRIAQSAGFSLDDIVKLLGIRDGTSDCCGNVEQVIRKRLMDVHQRVEDLHEVEQHLSEFLAMCESAANKRECAVLDQISRGSTSALP